MATNLLFTCWVPLRPALLAVSLTRGDHAGALSQREWRGPSAVRTSQGWPGRRPSGSGATLGFVTPPVTQNCTDGFVRWKLRGEPGGKLHVERCVPFRAPGGKLHVERCAPFRASGCSCCLIEVGRNKVDWYPQDAPGPPLPHGATEPSSLCRPLYFCYQNSSHRFTRN